MRIDLPRLLQRLADLAAIGAIAGTEGSCRLALTDADRAGRDLVRAWMTDLGLRVSTDSIGNVVGVLAGRSDGPPVMCGSHIDTVRTGGRYDGNFGVLAGLEVIQTVIESGLTTDRPLAVAFFTNEEGARFAPDMLGSLVYVGGLALDEARAAQGIDGTTVGAELDRIGYAGPSPVPGPTPYAYVELHIEQGPVLENEGVTIGAVTGVQGISWQEVAVTGQSNHAGTTPIHLRRDAALVAAEATLFARRLADEIGHGQVATIGRLELQPNLVNVVAGSARFTIDLRNTDGEVLAEAERRMAGLLAEAAAVEGCGIETTTLARFDPVSFDEAMIELVELSAKELGHSVKRLASGAGHDAQMLARVCPTAMIFTPSRGGISHNPAEHTAPADLEAGANVLLTTMLTLSAVDGGLDIGRNG